MNRSIVYSEICYGQVRKLHPELKPAIRSALDLIKENPYVGKCLQRELTGYLSFRVNRFRIIYKIDENDNIEIHYIGHRKDIYELFVEYKTLNK